MKMNIKGGEYNNQVMHTRGLTSQLNLCNRPPACRLQCIMYSMVLYEYISHFQHGIRKRSICLFNRNVAYLPSFPLCRIPCGYISLLSYFGDQNLVTLKHNYIQFLHLCLSTFYMYYNDVNMQRLGCY